MITPPRIPSACRRLAFCAAVAIMAIELPAATRAATSSAEESRAASAGAKPAAGAAGRRAGDPSADALKGEPARVEVAAVRFTTLSPSGNSALTWQETEIEVNVRPSTGKGENRFANRVKVTLTIAEDNPTGERSYYRTSAEAVALEVGRSNIRFYLPPEIVRRDKLHSEPKLYAVEISTSGQAMAPSKFSSNAPDATVFLSKAVEEAKRNNGILLPQYLTPFAYDSNKPAPVFVRLERDADKN